MRAPARPADVRAWAREQGFEVGTRGTLSASLKEAFTKATGRPVVTRTEATA